MGRGVVRITALKVLWAGLFDYPVTGHRHCDTSELSAIKQLRL